jgi:DNA-directed RNA polymerase specialized sigma24 family protein
VKRAVAGDEVATTVLLIIYPRLQQNLQRRIPRDIQALIDVDDVVQDTLIQIFQKIATFHSTGPDSFYRWVATIALYRLRNIIKAQRALKRGRGRTLSGIAKSEDPGSTQWLLDWLQSPENTPSHHASRTEAQYALACLLIVCPSTTGRPSDSCTLRDDLSKKSPESWVVPNVPFKTCATKQKSNCTLRWAVPHAFSVDLDYVP